MSTNKELLKETAQIKISRFSGYSPKTVSMVWDNARNNPVIEKLTAITQKKLQELDEALEAEMNKIIREAAKHQARSRKVAA